ncbi:MAG: phospholipase D-like domain-containing protein [Planctomycetaceae bacterium]
MTKILVAANLLVASGASLHLLLRYRRSTTAVAWLFAIWVLPFLGSLLYALLGVPGEPRAVRRRKARAEAIRGRGRAGILPKVPYPAGVVDPNLASLVDRAAPFPLTAGNAVDLLPGGGAAFDAMLAAIAAARNEIVLASYILDPGAVTRRLFGLLEERAAAGVSVRLLYDHFGSFRLSRGARNRLAAAGIRAAGFLRPNPFKRRLQINFRNHRKILVVDGREAFLGGLNWADEYDERLPAPRTLRDLHMRVRGPVVAALRRIFLEDYCIAADDSMEPGDAVVPAPEGVLCARAIPHGPDEETPGLTAVFHGAIQRARRDLLLVSPYFVPGGTMREALRIAALSGVRVRLLLPRRSDNAMADLAARHNFGPLLEAGAWIGLVDGDFLHAKALVVDGAWSCLGSANFDERSFHCNYEIGLEVPDREFAGLVEASFHGELARAVPLDARLFARRSPWHRALQNAAALFEPLL